MARTYRVFLDWDQDGAFCRGVLPGDPLNIIRGADHKALKHARASSVVTNYERRAEVTPWGSFVYAASKESSPSGSCGILFGATVDPTTDCSIPVTPSGTYTISVWVKAVASVPTITMRITRNPGNSLSTGTHGVTSGVWTRIDRTFSVSVYDRIAVRFTLPSGAGSIEIAGLMIVPGSAAPGVWNAGDSSNAYDEITDYVRDTLSFSDGLPYNDDFCEPSRLTVGLNNEDGFWNPSNADSPVYGKFRRGSLIRVEANDGDDIFPLWHGTTERFTYFGEDGVNRYAVLEAGDAALQLTDTEYAPRFLEDVRTDEALMDVFSSGAFRYPYAGAFGILDAPGFSELDENFVLFEDRVTDFLEGDTVLPYAGDNIDRGDGTNAQMYLREILATELGGRLFWDAVTAKYVFHNRLRDAVETLTEWTPGHPLDYPAPLWAWGEDVVNHVDLFYEVRHVGTPGTVVFEYDDVPLALAAGASRAISARFTSTDTEQQIAVKDGMVPVRGTDYDGNYTDAGMENAQNFISVYVEWAANTARINVVNTSERPLQVTLLQLRGTPVTTTKAQSVMARDPESIGLHGLHKMALNIRSINGEAFAQQVADVRAHQQSRPIKQLRSVAFQASTDPATASTILGARVGDLLNTDAGDGASLYIILARNHQIMVDTNEHIVEYAVKAIVRSTVLILDSPLRGLLDQAVIGL